MQIKQAEYNLLRNIFIDLKPLLQTHMQNRKKQFGIIWQFFLVNFCRCCSVYESSQSTMTYDLRWLCWKTMFSLNALTPHRLCWSSPHSQTICQNALRWPPGKHEWVSVNYYWWNVIYDSSSWKKNREKLHSSLVALSKRTLSYKYTIRNIMDFWFVLCALYMNI